MKTDCTELFIRYREVARLLWNVGFWVEPKLREWDALQLYREISARLFEALVLLPLGYQGRIERKDTPGNVANFQVVLRGPEAPLLVDRNLPHEPAHIWGGPEIKVVPESGVSLRFLRFFDWNELARRDFRFIEVLIEQFQTRPDLVGHRALAEVGDCSVVLVCDGPS
jgi:hypothetical protein